MCPAFRVTLQPLDWDAQPIGEPWRVTVSRDAVCQLDQLVSNHPTVTDAWSGQDAVAGIWLLRLSNVLDLALDVALVGNDDAAKVEDETKAAHLVSWGVAPWLKNK